MSNPFNDAENPFAEEPHGYNPNRWAPSNNAVQIQYQGKSQREAELDEREARIKAREVELDQRERKMGDFQPPNWPKCRPILYHDIEKDIPKQGQWLVKRLYRAFFLSAATYLVNFAACLALLIIKAESSGGNFGISLLILVVGTPVSWQFWYRPLYYGVKQDRSMSFFIFFFNYGVHLAVLALFAVGIPGWGAAGFIYLLATIGTDLGTGVLCAITCALIIGEGIYGLWQLKQVSSYYRSKGLTAEQAKQEATASFMASGIGRSVMANTASSYK